MVTLYANDEELLRKNIVYYFANTIVVSGEHILEPSFGNVPQSIGVFSFILSQIACSAYKVIVPRRVSTYMHALLSHGSFYYSVTPFLRKASYTRWYAYMYALF